MKQTIVVLENSSRQAIEGALNTLAKSKHISSITYGERFIIVICDGEVTYD